MVGCSSAGLPLVRRLQHALGCLESAAASKAAATESSPPAAGAAQTPAWKPTAIVDTHTHAGTNWFEPIEVLELQMRLNGVEKALLVQHGVPQHGNWDHDYLFECCRRYPGRFGVIVIVDVKHPAAVETLARHKASGAVGVRLGPEQRSPGPDPLAIWKAAERLQLVVSVMGGGDQISSSEFHNLIRALPKLKFVIEHMAGAGQDTRFPISAPTPSAPYDAFMKTLAVAQFPNVFLKMTGLNELARRPDALPLKYSHRFYDASGGVPPFLRLAIGAFGCHRIMWGSDFPPVAGREGYRNSLAAVLEDPSLTREEVEWIASKTARSVFAPAAGQLDVRTVRLSEWARDFSEQDRADLVRCAQIGAMAFNKNSERTKPTLEIEPGVPQYRWTEGVDAVPVEMSEDAIDRSLASWRKDSVVEPGWTPTLGVAGRRNHQWHIARVDGVVVAVAKTAEVTVTLTGESRQETIVTLGGVATDPRRAGNGYGSAVVRAALARCDADNRMLLFQTGDALPMYLKLGCAKLDHALVINTREDNTDAKRPFADYHAVIYPPSRVPSRGPIDLHGPGW